MFSFIFGPINFLKALPLRSPPFCSVGACRVIAVQDSQEAPESFSLELLFQFYFKVSPSFHYKFLVVYAQYEAAALCSASARFCTLATLLQNQMEVSKYWKWTCFVLFVIISIWTFKDF
jgi:hypothetical protein